MFLCFFKEKKLGSFTTRFYSPAWTQTKLLRLRTNRARTFHDETIQKFYKVGQLSQTNRAVLSIK